MFLEEKSYAEIVAALTIRNAYVIDTYNFIGLLYDKVIEKFKIELYLAK